MTSVFSAISGQFGRAFVIAALLPAALFVLALQRFVFPEWPLAVLIAAGVCVAGLLHVLNVPIVRLYEGYPWMDGAIGKWRIARHRRKLQEAIDGRVAAREARVALRAIDPELAARLQSAQNAMASRVFNEYPLPGSVLPTRLGNVIRSFENYPRRQYGIWAVTLFPRFVAKIPKEFAAVIDDAKSMLDVLLHLSFLSLLFSLIVLVTTESIACIAIGLVLSAMFYAASVGRASEWGQLVRASFDLYRWDVLRDLGFTSRPATMLEERALWNEISRQLAFGDTLAGADLSYDIRSAVTPSLPELRLTRGVTPLDVDTQRVTVRVQNAGADPIAAVSIIETVPPGSAYVWGSATVEVQGTNPYRFLVGDLAPKATVEITYDVFGERL
jgi:uncharacterized repeat protein (TIGR01451 family)